jgi:propane monooxygenase small subunit
MINNAMAVNAAHKLRFAQDLALYNLDLEESIEDFDGQLHREVWQDDPVWQGVRKNVELLTAVGDWGEALFATNMIFEPLVGTLFRSHLVMQIAARNGDYVTPTLVGAGENDFARDHSYTRVLFELLVRDEAEGEHNKAKLNEWIAHWVPQSLKAARELQPIWSQPQEKTITFSESLEAAKDDFRTTLGELDLPEPKELNE